MNFGSNEDTYTLTVQNNLLKKKRGYTFKLPPPKSSIIVLFSGGIDSVSLISLLAIKYKYHIYPLYFILNNENKKQRKAIEFFNSYFQHRFPNQFNPVEIRKFFHLFSFRDTPSSAEKVWSNFDLISENTSYYSPIQAYRTFFPNNPTRQGHYAFGAYDYHLYLRYKKGVIVNTALTAITHSDRLLRECNLSVIRSMNIAICSITGDYSFQFSAPTESGTPFCFNKDELARFALKNGIPLHKTWSCVFRKEEHCGFCQSCIERKILFSDLGTTDSTTYKNTHTTSLYHRAKNKLSLFFTGKISTSDSPTNLVNNPDITISYRVNDNIQYKKTKEGYFVSVQGMTSYCLFSKSIDIKLFQYILKRKTILPSQLLGRRVKKSKVVTDADLKEFITLSLSSGVLSEFKKK